MQPITLEIRDLGPVPAFKNSKMLTRGRIIAKPEFQVWMQRAIRSLEFQLRSVIPTTGVGTLTEQEALCLIVSLLPDDDSRQWIPELSIKAVSCDKGNDGATIEITPI
jgi:hypothetical protein